MKIIPLWISVILFIYVSLALVSYLENGYEEEQLSEEVLQTAILQAKAETALVKRELHMLTVEGERMSRFKDN